MRSKRLLTVFLVAGLFTALFGFSRAEALSSFQVDSAANASGLAENTLYGSPINWSMLLDPATIGWIGWNDQASTHSIGGTEYVGMGDAWIGTDDYFVLTIENPSGATKSVIMDYNYHIAKSVGTQAIIYGPAAAAPNTHRWYFGYGYNLTTPWTGDPSDPIPGLAWDGNTTQTTHHVYSDEDGAFNDIFTVAGQYDFTMTYGNTGTQVANHPDMWILVDGPASLVPEPSTALLLAAGLAGLAAAGRRRSLQ